MAFNKEINKTVSVGAYQVTFNDDKKTAQISYSQYEDDVAVAFVKTINISFDKLAETDLEGFTSVMAYIQTLCDSYNPENPDKLEPIEQPIEG
jgi:hypothetical protein